MKYLKLLYIQVIIGIVAGIIAGYLFPSFAAAAQVISDTFINMIRMVIAPVIFFTIVSGIAGTGDLKQAGRIGGKAIIYFELVTTFALVLGVVIANLAKPGVGINYNNMNPDNVAQFTKQGAGMNWGAFFAHIVPTNIVDSFAKGDILQVLFFSILFGIGLKWMGKSGIPLLHGFDKINKVLFNILKIVMAVSPIGAFGGMAYTIGKFGFGSLALLGNLLLVFFASVLFFIFIVLNLIARYYKFSLWKLLVYLKEEVLIVLASASSEVALPAVMKKLEDAGCEKEVVGLVIPTGYSFNLDGTTIYLSIAIIFLAQVFNVELSLGQQLSIIGILLLTSKGAAGVAGGGFIVLASTLTAIKVIPLEGLGLLIGVDRFMSGGRSITNFIGNAIATVVIAKSEKAIDESRYHSIVELGQPVGIIYDEDIAIDKNPLDGTFYDNVSPVAEPVKTR